SCRGDGIEFYADGVFGKGSIIVGSGHYDRARQGEGLRLVEDIVSADSESASGGDAGERIAEAAGQGRDVVEGQDVIVEGERKKVVLTLGRNQQRRGGGVDEIAQRE